MVTRRILLGAALSLACAGLTAPFFQARAQSGPVAVVELFTSQGCSSCPPADALMGELVQRDDVLGLTFHVDYWDYLGWRDTFATPEGTQRQRNYRQALAKSYVYTPQMVIGGVADTVGSQRAAVEREIDRVIQSGGGQLKVMLALDHEDRVLARIGPGNAATEATVWLVRYDRRHDVEVRRGENAGNKLSYFNVVRDVTEIGKWTGGTIEIPLATTEVLRMGGRDACAVIVQEGGAGRILGAARFAFGDQDG
jgi:hypothetical protein